MENLIKSKYGFYTLEVLPTEEEIQQYYEHKYYQEAKGSYEIEYDEDEKLWIKNKILESVFVIENNVDINGTKRFLDVGCGEGWALKVFKEKGWTVSGLDFSSYGCEKFNPDCVENLKVGDVYDNISSLILSGEEFDVIYLDNVLEHVVDPEMLINELKKIISPAGILVVDVPNDFSLLQNYLSNKGYIDKKYWITTPDHLSYFNKESLENLLSNNGWQTILCLADYPIDWNLVNPETNYIKNGTKGKSCHRERIEMENLIHTQPIEKVIKFYSALCDVGMGRSIIGYFKKK